MENSERLGRQARTGIEPLYTRAIHVYIKFHNNYWQLYYVRLRSTRTVLVHCTSKTSALFPHIIGMSFLNICPLPPEVGILILQYKVILFCFCVFYQL